MHEHLHGGDNFSYFSFMFQMFLYICQGWLRRNPASAIIRGMDYFIGGFGGQIYWRGGGQVGVEATRDLPKFNTFSNNGVWESKSYSVHIGYNLVYIFSS